MNLGGGAQADLALGETTRLWLRYEAARSSHAESHTGTIGIDLAV